ncbi:MAG: TetR/AcrR family transcriptional regulator [Amphritea sp.]|nr:TetR/AcrR family transcriptional regulator [Amphritea sp.]
MANVAKYDRDSVVRKAMLLFWEKGFNATSTRDLQQAVDMRPGSIYAAFGSKEGLYSEALKCYSQEMGEILQQRVSEADSPLTGLENFIRNVIIERRNVVPSELCMLVRTLSEIDDTQPELMSQTKTLLRKVEDNFTRILDQAQEQGELAPGANTRMLGRHLQVQMIGMRTYLKASQNPQAVEELLQSIFAGIRVR